MTRVGPFGTNDCISRLFVVVFTGFIYLFYHIKLGISKLSDLHRVRMIYLRLHQAGSEGIEAETSWMQAGICRMQAGVVGKFR